jgi:hypothetical protein
MKAYLEALSDNFGHGRWGTLFDKSTAHNGLPVGASFGEEFYPEDAGPLADTGRDSELLYGWSYKTVDDLEGELLMDEEDEEKDDSQDNHWDAYDEFGDVGDGYYRPLFSETSPSDDMYGPSVHNGQQPANHDKNTYEDYYHVRTIGLGSPRTLFFPDSHGWRGRKRNKLSRDGRRELLQLKQVA